MGERWGHYSRNKVRGHRNISTSSYAEQNHASIKAMAPDDPHRPVEHHVIAIMNGDKNLINQRQKEKYQWHTVAASHLNEKPAQRASHLSTARNALDHQSYAHFVREYDHSLQYYAEDEERDGVMGCVIRHALIRMEKADSFLIVNHAIHSGCARRAEL